MTGTGTTFGLVHGAWHGAWCWDRLTSELEARGHRAVAVELPASDPRAGLTSYAEVIAESLGDAGDVVLVGHSLGSDLDPDRDDAAAGAPSRLPLRAAAGAG